MSALGQAIAYSAPNRVIFLSKVAQLKEFFNSNQRFRNRAVPPPVPRFPYCRTVLLNESDWQQDSATAYQ